MKDISNSEKFIMIRNAMVEPIRFNVDISYRDDEEVLQSEQRGNKTGENWAMKKEYFNGLTATQVDHLSLLMAAYGIEHSIRVHQVGKD